jgi:ubiquitin carboxyl-terminal hydrolase 34
MRDSNHCNGKTCGLKLLFVNVDSHQPYSWDTWPHDEERAKCGFVGLTNLGATCYMATCMQHLYMIPEARKTIIEAKVRNFVNDSIF